jgi:ferredoxin
MSIRVTVDHDRCVGSTMCIQIAGTVFSLDEAGQSIVQDPTGADTDTVVDAASQCPMEAITVVDTESGTTLFP